MSYLAARLSTLTNGVGSARAATSTICNSLHTKNVFNAVHLRAVSKWGNQQYQSRVIPFASAYRANISDLTSKTLFHTSPSRNIPPIVVVVLKPIAKAASIITGRTLRKWWRSLSEDRKIYWRDRFAEKRWLLLAGGSFLILGGFVHYFTHIKETPVTHRRRYLAFNEYQFKELAEFEYSMQLENVKDKIVSPDHDFYKRVTNVVQRIVNSNQDLDYMRQQTWTIVVVDSDEMNAFVIPTGHIFVFTGLLKLVDNDSQLAVVLGHEMAHGLLSHAAEQVSFATIIDVFIIIVMAAIWAFMPTDGIAVVTQWFYHKAVQIMLHLPYNRKLEEEADYVGLVMMAKACFDVRESSTFWNKMTLASEDKDNVEIPQFLSTHPNNDSRAQSLDNWIPMAVDVRESCNCPKLPSRDPRANLAYLRQLIAEKKALDAAATKSSEAKVVLPVAVVLPQQVGSAAGTVKGG